MLPATNMSTNPVEATIATNIAVLRREREDRHDYFEQIDGEGSPQRIELDQLQMKIGRADDAHVRLSSRRASRYHALLIRRGADFVIRDTESHNGVFLNGLKIHSATLRDGDVIQIGDYAFIYREG